MKKLIFITLITLIPILTIAQNRNKNNKQENINNASYDFMIIKGYTIGAVANMSNTRSGDVRGEERIKITFDFGGLTINEALVSKQYRTMAHAVNASTEYGWEFINANVISSGSSGQNKEHFYYMRRMKK